MLNLDTRDFTFWLEEAQKKKISEQIDKLLTVRFAMHASGSDFGRALNKLEWDLIKLKGLAVDIVRENWEELKRIGRG